MVGYGNSFKQVTQLEALIGMPLFLSLYTVQLSTNPGNIRMLWLKAWTVDRLCDCLCLYSIEYPLMFELTASTSSLSQIHSQVLVSKQLRNLL